MVHILINIKSVLKWFNILVEVSFYILVLCPICHAEYGKVRLGYCFTPYQRLWLYNGAPFSRLLRHAGDTEDVFSA